MCGHFQRLLQNIVEHPDAAISQLSLLSEEERAQQLVEWNETVSYPRRLTLHELFEAQAAATPEAIALVYEAEQLSYRELNERANQLGHYLRELGVGPETLVGLCFERSMEMVVALLGVLKAGGAYLPLDPQYPAERLAFMVAGCGHRAAVDANAASGGRAGMGRGADARHCPGAGVGTHQAKECGERGRFFGG